MATMKTNKQMYEAMTTEPATKLSLGATTKPMDMASKMFAGPKKPEAKTMAKGGYVRAADGCAQRGKTKGRIL